MDRLAQLSPKRRALHDEIFRAALEAAHGCAERDFEAAARWALLSAEVADKLGCGTLMSTELEGLLLGLATRIPLPNRGRPSDQRRWLHVFSETFGIGGHTALASRWIAKDGGQDRHSVFLTFQEAAAVPATLDRAVLSKGGSIYGLGGLNSLVERARRLREIAWRDFDVVVLHIHMWDVVPVLAFGVPGGPPVMLLNHADHTFWLGACVADCVINLRESGREVTRRYRGIDRLDYLPIPLPTPTTPSLHTRRAIRLELGIPDRAPIFLTVGSNFKYLGVGDLSFIDAACNLLKKLPDTYLIAVGPYADHPDWKVAKNVSNGRLIAVGPQADLTGYFAAADVYLEGFPFGSLTALLEAGISGLPCVRAPISCPPPFTSDGEALEHLPQPANLDDYIDQATALAASPASRQSQSEELKLAISNVHLGPGWQLRLDAVKARIPEEHNTYQSSAPISPPLWDQYWIPYLARRLDGDPFLFFYVTGRKLGLAIRPTMRTLLAWQSATVQERPKGAPGPLALVLFGRLIDPIAGVLPFSKTNMRRGWWPLMLFGYWFRRYVGWRLKAGTVNTSVDNENPR